MCNTLWLYLHCDTSPNVQCYFLNVVYDPIMFDSTLQRDHAVRLQHEYDDLRSRSQPGQLLSSVQGKMTYVLCIQQHVCHVVTDAILKIYKINQFQHFIELEYPPAL